MRFIFLCLMVSASAHAQHTPTHASLAGTWRGSSQCTKDSGPACHDEVVVYHFSRAGAHHHPSAPIEQLQWVMNKEVSGREEGMATLTCVHELSVGGVACPAPRGWRWAFLERGDTLRGTLVSPAGATWRDVLVVRVR